MCCHGLLKQAQVLLLSSSARGTLYISIPRLSLNSK